MSGESHLRARAILRGAGHVDRIALIGALRDLTDAVEEQARHRHRDCLAAWQRKIDSSPGVQITMHDWDAHLP